MDTGGVGTGAHRRLPGVEIMMGCHQRMADIERRWGDLRLAAEFRSKALARGPPGHPPLSTRPALILTTFILRFLISLVFGFREL